jgi:hypothetical protein
MKLVPDTLPEVDNIDVEVLAFGQQDLPRHISPRENRIDKTLFGNLGHFDDFHCLLPKDSLNSKSMLCSYRLCSPIPITVGYKGRNPKKHDNDQAHFQDPSLHVFPSPLATTDEQRLRMY